MKKAKKSALSIKPEGIRSGYLQQIASAQIEAGKIDGAKETLASAKDAALQITIDSTKLEFLQQIAKVQVEARDKDGAKATVATITDPYDKSSALRDLAKVQVKANDIDGAKETLALAKETAFQITINSTKLESLEKITAAELIVKDRLDENAARIKEANTLTTAGENKIKEIQGEIQDASSKKDKRALNLELADLLIELNQAERLVRKCLNNGTKTKLQSKIAKLKVFTIVASKQDLELASTLCEKMLSEDKKEAQAAIQKAQENQ